MAKLQLRDLFEQHLDSCPRCADSPFDLCPVGAKLLGAAAEQALVELPVVLTVRETDPRSRVFDD